MSGGGQLVPSGGETVNRYASERSRSTSVNAKRSGGPFEQLVAELAPGAWSAWIVRSRRTLAVLHR
jgi:hypothetical protein